MHLNPGAFGRGEKTKNKQERVWFPVRRETALGSPKFLDGKIVHGTEKWADGCQRIALV